MKKYIALLLVLALALTLLTSCELMVPGPTERPPIGPSGEPAPTETPVPLPPAGPALPVFVPAEYDPRYDDDPNFMNDQFAQNNMCATTDTVYFAYQSSKTGEMHIETIYFLDKATGYVGPLCGKPECLHDNEDCNACIYSARSFGLSVYDGRLYWMERPYLGLYRMRIWSVALDGSDRRLVLEQDFEPLQNMSFTGLFHRGYFYLLGHYRVVTNGEANEHICLVAWPLKEDSEARIILDMPLGLFMPYFGIQAYGDGVYILVEGDYDADLNGKLWLLRWNTATQELETFYAGKCLYSSVPYIAVTDDGWFIYTYKDELFRFDFESGVLEELASPEPISARYNDLEYYGSTLSANLIVMDGLMEDGVLAVLVQNRNGTILLDQTYQLGTGLAERYTAFSCFGRDETNLYLSNNAMTKVVVIAVALDGSGAEVLFEWDNETGAH